MKKVSVVQTPLFAPQTRVYCIAVSSECFCRTLVYVFKRELIKPFAYSLYQLTSVHCNIWMKILSKCPFQWHTRTLLTWDFDHELSRCTYTGNLQRAPQRAPARAKQWWVFGQFVHICHVITAIGCFQIDSFLVFFTTAAVAGTSAGEEEDVLPTYKEAFPPLPEKAASPEGTQESANAWTSKIRPLKSSIITQVCHFQGLKPVFSCSFLVLMCCYIFKSFLSFLLARRVSDSAQKLLLLLDSRGVGATFLVEVYSRSCLGRWPSTGWVEQPLPSRTHPDDVSPPILKGFSVPSCCLLLGFPRAT